MHTYIHTYIRINICVCIGRWGTRTHIALWLESIKMHHYVTSFQV